MTLFEKLAVYAIVGITLLCSSVMVVHAFEPTKDARGIPLTVIVETVPKSAIMVRCKLTYRPSAACAFVGPQGCHIIMPEPENGVPDNRWFKILGHEMAHCTFGNWHK